MLENSSGSDDPGLVNVCISIQHPNAHSVTRLIRMIIPLPFEVSDCSIFSIPNPQLV